MQRSMTRIRTLHGGRLPPPKGWEDMPARLAAAEITDPSVIGEQITPAIAETVRRRVETGIDCIGDGEFWTARSLAHYTARFTGIEARPAAPGEPPTSRHSTRERDEFPNFYGDMDRAETLFLVPGEKPMPPGASRRSQPGKIKRMRSHQPPARHLQGRDHTRGRQRRRGVRRRVSTRLARPLHLQTNTTRQRKNSCSPWRAPFARNIGRWWMLGSCCRSTTQAHRTRGTC
jgi:hypothetical protein